MARSTSSQFSFSPNGERLAFAGNGKGGSFDIFTAPIESDSGNVRLGKPELFLGTRFNEGYSAFSPDGPWLAYASDESGTFEVFVRPFPGPGGKLQISKGGGMFPLWSRDGHELLFAALDGQVMAVGYSVNADSFVAGKPRVWSKTRLLDSGAIPNYDLAPDGRRLAAILPSNEPPTHLTFLLNFFDELRRRAPAGGK
jgi:serine/threonine-protein kinase